MLPTALLHFKLHCVKENIHLVLAISWQSVFLQNHFDMYINTLKTKWLLYVPSGLTPEARHLTTRYLCILYYYY